MRAEIDMSLIGYDCGSFFPKFTWYFAAMSAGLATRFRTHTHARVIDDNVPENDLCHVVRCAD